PLNMTEKKRSFPLQRISVHPLNDAKIVPDSHCTEPHVKIGETNPEQAHPRPKHVAAIETGHTCIGAVARWRARKLVQKSAGQMSKRMATNRIAAQQNNIDC